MSLKICYVATDVEIPYTGVSGSGGSAHVYEVSRNLVELGNDIHIICMKGHKKQRTSEKLDGINVHRMYTGADQARVIQRDARARKILDKLIPTITRIMAIFFGLRIAYIVNKNRCDLIYERSSSLGAGSIASILTRKPLVLEVNDPIVTSLSLKRAKKMVTTKKSMLRGEVANEKTIEVSWAANTQMFNPSVNAEDVIEEYDLEDKHVILYTGSFAPWHGVEDIIKAAKIVTGNVKNIIFFMVGTGPEMPRYKGTVSQLNLGDFFIFTGPKEYEKIPQFICASDITLAPFNPERNELMREHGFYFTPLKIFEYMACGKPLISTSVGNVKNIIEDGVSGILVPPGNSDALAKNILRLLSDEDLRKKLGSNAREVVETKYSWKMHVERLQEIFEGVLKN